MLVSGLLLLCTRMQHAKGEACFDQGGNVSTWTVILRECCQGQYCGNRLILIVDGMNH